MQICTVNHSTHSVDSNWKASAYADGHRRPLLLKGYIGDYLLQVIINEIEEQAQNNGLLGCDDPRASPTHPMGSHAFSV